MALTKKFLRSLDEAIERRAEYLRRLVVPAGQGAPMKYTRKVRDRLKKEAPVTCQRSSRERSGPIRVLQDDRDETPEVYCGIRNSEQV